MTGGRIFCHLFLPPLLSLHDPSQPPLLYKRLRRAKSDMVLKKFLNFRKFLGVKHRTRFGHAKPGVPYSQLPVWHVLIQRLTLTLREGFPDASARESRVWKKR